MRVLADFRARDLRRRVEGAEREYEAVKDDAPRRALQLELLNRTWAEVAARVPHWKSLVQRGELPGSFASLEEFAAKVPPTTKDMIRAGVAALSDASRPAEGSLTSGGSTGEPLSIPCWDSENRKMQAERWLARRWCGIDPADRVFLLWGHRHLMGAGLAAKINGAKRALKDWALGYKRFWAYDLGEARARRCFEELRDFRAGYVVGYAGSLEAIARANMDRAGTLGERAPRLVVATAESFPSPDGQEVVARVLGCPCVMEYGSVETAILAQGVPGEPGLRVLWRAYLLDCGEPNPDGSRPLYVTSLYPRAFPLVRFDMGDAVLLPEGEPTAGPARLASVVGKLNTAIVLPGGARIHSESIRHAAGFEKAIIRYQIVRRGGAVSMRIVPAAGEEPGGLRSRLRERLGKVHPELAGIEIEFAETLHQTVAGKTPVYIDLDKVKTA